MNKIAAIFLLYVLAILPVYAADDTSSMAQNLNKDEPNQPAEKADNSAAERLSTFSLWQPSSKFSLYGKLSIRGSATGDSGTDRLRSAPTYGLHGQLESTSNMGIRFAWDRYMSGQSSGDNLYSLTATFKF